MQRVSPVVLYTASRIAIFVACLGLLYVFGMHGILLIAVGFVVSGLLSFVLLNRQRDAMSAAVTERAARMRQRFDERLTAEDLDDEAVDDPARSSGEREADGEKDGEGKL
jgi:low affinity Fe/Cu permease